MRESERYGFTQAFARLNQQAGLLTRVLKQDGWPPRFQALPASSSKAKNTYVDEPSEMLSLLLALHASCLDLTGTVGYS